MVIPMAGRVRGNGNVQSHHNVSFIWLTRSLTPDHKAISEFRRNHKKALKEILKQSVRICRELDLIDSKVLFVDGTKIRANAARGKNYTKQHGEKKPVEIDKNIEVLLDECERIDKEKDAQDSLVKMKKDLADNEEYRNRVQDILNQFKEQDGYFCPEGHRLMKGNKMGAQKWHTV